MFREEAVKEYEYRANTRLGKLVANRELPILYRAKEIIDLRSWIYTLFEFFDAKTSVNFD